MKFKLSTSINLRNIEIVLELLKRNPEEIQSIVHNVAPQTLITRQNPNTWAFIEILSHLHACASIWGASIFSMLDENSPTLEEIHPGKWHRLAEFNSLAFDDFLNLYVQQRKMLIARLESLEMDDWHRFAWINNRKHTVFSQARRMALHEFDHLDQFREQRKLIQQNHPISPC